MLDVSGNEASSRFDDESAISGCWLKQARSREICFAVPTDSIQNPTNHLRLGVNSTAAMECLDFR
jgi:hypothetical protein